MAALEIRKDRTPVVLRRLEKENRLVAEAGRITSLCSYPWIPRVK